MESSEPQPTILLVDDDEIILVALAETLKLEGYNTISFNDARDALAHLAKEDVAVIITDQKMPEMTGLEFLAKAKNIQPNASRILVTGVLKLKTVIDAVNKGEIFRFLAKPWIREELLATVRNAAQRYRLLTINEKLHKDTLILNDKIAEANADLKRNIEQISKQKEELDAAHRALAENFDYSLELCYRIINSYHPMLGAETKSIVELCETLNEHSPLSDKEKHVLKVSAWMQNIGLIGISRELLTRARKNPKSLSERESEIINNHPIYGQTLATFKDDLADVGITIRAHHERWDGKGYPDGLRQEAIPRPARYLAVVVYFVECGYPKDEAIERILRLSGSAFDPEAVRLFLKATRMIALPKKVKEVLLGDLEPGMVLAKGIYSPTGILLIPEGSRLNESILNKIQRHNMIDPINHRLIVYS